MCSVLTDDQDTLFRIKQLIKPAQPSELVTYKMYNYIDVIAVSEKYGLAYKLMRKGGRKLTRKGGRKHAK